MPVDGKKYDVVVIGSGSGAAIVEAAVGQGLHVAWVDDGPLGGTCANVGCIPSKMVITPADRVMDIREARKLGIRAEVQEIDFSGIMDRMRVLRGGDKREMQEALGRVPNLDFFPVEGRFVDEHTLAVGDQRISGKKFFILAGARPLIPPVPGLDQVDYLTNDTVFDLQELPASMILLGGGYITTELAHFFSAMGSDVTIVGRNPRLVPEEEPAVSELLRKKLSERMSVLTDTEAISVRQDGSTVTVVGRNRATGQESQLAAQSLLVAAGRRSNADRLQVENAGIPTDQRGFIKVNRYLETGVPKIWAAGDIIGRQMFKHSANRAASLAWHNSQHRKKVAMDLASTPHAVFTYPQIAAVGLTEEQAKEHHKVLVGWARYSDVAYGRTLMEEEGFAKAIIDADSGKILGFHIIGPQAAILIQEVVHVMASGSTAGALGLGMHIHPALSELVLRALSNLHSHD